MAEESIPEIIPARLCQCGCGGATTIPNESNGGSRIKGVPMRFISGHNSKVDPNMRGSSNHGWKGGRYIHGGYVRVMAKDHPRADEYGYVLEHILVAERVLGYYLPLSARVHHVNEVKHENVPGNLVICEDQHYHLLLHVRMKALRACGNPDFVRCRYCHQYDSPSLMSGSNYTEYQRTIYYHRECRRQHA